MLKPEKTSGKWRKSKMYILNSDMNNVFMRVMYFFVFVCMNNDDLLIINQISPRTNE